MIDVPPGDTGTQARGFTLVETIVVVAIMGLIATVLAATFTVVVRTTPSAEARADDSRSLNALTNWLSQDVASTSESGFVTGDLDPPCDAVPPSIGLLELRWGSSRVNYRWVSNTAGGLGAIYRYRCRVNEPAIAQKVTADMRPAPPSSTLALAPAPVKVNLLPTFSGNAGNGGIEFFVYVFDAAGNQRELLRLDATTRNVRQTLPPLPPGGGGGGGSNQPPTALRTPIDASRGQDVNYSPLPVGDPDNDPLIVTLDDSLVPNSWNPTATYNTTTNQWDLAFSVHPSAVPGEQYRIPYTACDDATPAPACDSDEIVVTIIPPPDMPPVADPLELQVLAGTSVTNQLLPVSDENVLTASVELRNAPVGWNASAQCRKVVGQPGCYLSFTTGAGDPSATFEYRVLDAAGQENVGSWRPIAVDVTQPPRNEPPTAANASFAMAAGETLNATLPVSDENPPALTYELGNVPAGWVVGASGTTITITPAAAAVGTYLIDYRVTDDVGQSNSGGDMVISVNVSNGVPTAAPASSPATKGRTFSVLLPAADPEGQALNVSFARPAGWPAPTVTQTVDGPLATFSVPNNAARAAPYEFNYTVTDPANQTATAKLTVTVCHIQSVTVDPAVSFVNVNGSLTQPVTISITRNSGCGSLIVAFDPQNANNQNPAIWRDFGSTGTQVSIGAGEFQWTRPNGNSTINVVLRFRQGFTNTVEETTANLPTRKSP